MGEFTLSDVLSFLGWVLGGAVALKSGVSAIVDIIRAIKAPNDAQNNRIKALEDNKENHCDQCFERDKKAIEALKDGNGITQQALLALLGHALHGNNVEEMELAYKSVTNYLIYKKQ